MGHSENEYQNDGAKGPSSGGLWRRLRKYIWLAWLLLMIPVVYFAVQVVLILAPSMRYEVAMMHTMTESLDVVGQVVLNGQPVYSDGGGYPYYTVPTGQRVAAGADIALIFDSETGVQAMDNLNAINTELDNLYDAQQTVAQGGDMEGLLGELQEGLYGVLSGVEACDYTSLDGAKNEMALASNKMQIAAGDAVDFRTRIAQLHTLKTQYEAMAQAVSTVQSPAVGFFVPSSLRDAIPMDYETISAMPPDALKTALHQPPAYYGSEVAGHIVSDFKWSFFMTVSAKDSEKFVKGDKSLKLSFPDAGNMAVPVQVNEVVVDEENDVASVELYCEYVSPEVLVLRVEQAQILFGEYKGIRLSKSALRMMDVTNDDGSINTYKGVYIEFGNMVYFKRIEIIMEDDFYMIIPNEVVDGVNEVRLYDKVITDSGGVELYDKKIL